MADLYMRELLRVAVAQVCQTIGYHVIQATPLELLQDTLHRFLHEFSRDLRRQVEHYNRTETNLNDIFHTLDNLNIDVNELLDYINNVQPVCLAIEVPKFPAHKSTNLNFLKPGSREVLTRPVHVYEYLPPMLPIDSRSTLPAHYIETSPLRCNNSDKYRANTIAISDINQKVSGKSEHYLTGSGNLGGAASNAITRHGEPQDSEAVSEHSPMSLKSSISLPHSYDEEGRPTREISSVVMTTGGFISPAIEGKLPDTIIPKFVEKLLGFDAPPPPTPPPPPIVEGNPDIENDHLNKSSTDQIEVKDSTISLSSHPLKASTTVPKPPISTEGASNKNFSLTPASKDNIIDKNTAVSDVVNAASDSKKPISNHLSQLGLPTPTLASKLLKKAKKKNSQNLLNPLAEKMNRTDLQNSEIDSISTGTENPGKIQSKNKKLLTNMFTIEASKLPPDYCNPAVQRMTIEKLIKKQLKNQKKLMHKQKTGIASNKSDKTPGFSKLRENKALVRSKTQMKAMASLLDSLPKPSFSQESPPPRSKQVVDKTSPELPQPLIKDVNLYTGSNTVDEPVIDNVQMPTNLSVSADKKAFPGLKLSAELDKNKSNIFKKISKQKAQKLSSPTINRVASAQIYVPTEGQFINLPCGTTITTTPSRLTSGDIHTAIPDLLDNSLNLPHDLGGALNLASDVDREYTETVMPCESRNPPPQLVEVNKPKKRGRKPGSKNLPKPDPSHSNPSQVAQLKKMKKLKLTKYNYPFPLENLEPPNIMANRMQLSSRVPDFTSNLSHGDETVPTNLSANVKDNRKERKKGREKKLSYSMSKSEQKMSMAKSLQKLPYSMANNDQTLFKLGPTAPTKDEVFTINKKLMRMDTVLQQLGTFNEAIVEMEKDDSKIFPAKMLPTQKSPTNRKRSGPQMPLQHHSNSSLMSGLHPNMFMPTAGLGRIPNLLKLCPFPPGPGLIPPTAQNLLFPRLPPTFHLPIPTFKPQGADKVLNTESGSNGKSIESLLPQPSGERSYCNVPPFVPESMQLTPPVPKVDIRKLEGDVPKNANPQQSPENILKNAENWGIPDNSCKSVATVPVTMSLNTCEIPRSLERNVKSPKAIMDSPIFAGGLYSQTTPPIKTLTKPSVIPVINNDDPIELSDDSVEYPLPSVFNSLNAPNSKELNQNQPQVKAPPVVFPYAEDIYMHARNDSAMEAQADLDIISKDPKKSKKANKFTKSTKICYPNPTADLSSIDLFSTDKSGVGKLAGGADLIPLISTGSAYSSKTIPSTSLTATVSAPFVLPKKDFSPAHTFENALLAADGDSRDFLGMNTELQKKKKEHKRLKKLKDEKAKKKKDKKSKNKERIDRPEKILHKTDKPDKEKLKESLQCDEEQQMLNKDLLKKLKKEKKKKYKQQHTGATEQTDIVSAVDSPGAGNIDNPANFFSMGNPMPNLSSAASVTCTTPSLVPKLTLKLSSGQSPTHVEDSVPKQFCNVPGFTSIELGKKREPSPELARISPLVTRPQKQKFSISETVTSSVNCKPLAPITPSGNNTNSTLDALPDNSVHAVIPPVSSTAHSVVPPPSPWSTGGTLSASSVLLPQQLLQSSKAQEHLDGVLLANTIGSAARPLPSAERHSPVPLISETSRPSSYIDAEGNRVWICPACGKVDDGSPMIGCDGCDAWYHWICVGISVAPKENEDWFCRVCITRKKGIHASDKKRKRNKKK